MSVNNESKRSATPLLPHTMLLLDGTFCSTLNGGGGGLEFYTNNRFGRSSSVFNNFLNTFVPDCSFILNTTITLALSYTHTSFIKIAANQNSYTASEEERVKSFRARSRIF